MSTLLSIWNEIPDGSRFELSLGPAAGQPPLADQKVTATAQVVDAVSGDLVEKWEFRELVEGVELPVRTGQQTAITLFVRFLAPGSLVIHARVVTEAGTTFGAVIDEPVQGSTGATLGFQLILVALE